MKNFKCKKKKVLYFYQIVTVTLTTIDSMGFFFHPAVLKLNLYTIHRLRGHSAFIVSNFNFSFCIHSLFVHEKHLTIYGCPNFFFLFYSYVPKL